MKAWHALLVFAGIALGMFVSPKWQARADAHAAAVSDADSVAAAAAEPHGDAATNAMLKKILARLDRLEAARGAAPAPAQRERASDDDDSEPKPFVAPLSDPAESRRKNTELFESALTAQTRDSAWARATENEITDALRAPELAGNQITDMECRQSLCKLRVKHTTQAASDFLPMSLPMTLRSLGSAWFVQDNDHGELSTLFYFARHGTQLPELPQGM